MKALAGIGTCRGSKNVPAYIDPSAVVAVYEMYLVSHGAYGTQIALSNGTCFDVRDTPLSVMKALGLEQKSV